MRRAGPAAVGREANHGWSNEGGRGARPHRRRGRRIAGNGAIQGEAARRKATGFPGTAAGRYTCTVPALLRVRGYRFFFYSMESREPAHIHVAHAGRYAKFWLEPVSLANARGFRGHELTEIQEIVVEHRELFWERWNEYFGGQS